MKYNLLIYFQLRKHHQRSFKKKLKAGKWVTLCSTVGYKWVTVMNDCKIGFNDKISSYSFFELKQNRKIVPCE